jgi:hypothetical protein
MCLERHRNRSAITHVWILRNHFPNKYFQILSQHTVRYISIICNVNKDSVKFVQCWNFVIEPYVSRVSVLTNDTI